MTATAVQPVMTGCRDECGRSVEGPELKGWTYLQITKRWRCPQCTRDLAAIDTKEPNADTEPLAPQA